MTTRYMRLIDKVIGTPVCIILAMLFRILHQFIPVSAPYPANEVKRILCIKFFGAGSILLATPLFAGLKRKYPHAKLMLITFDSNMEFAAEIKYIDEIYPFRKKNIMLFLYDFFYHAWFFWRNRVDISIDLEFFAKTPIILALTYLSRFRIGLHSKTSFCNELLSKTVIFNPDHHISEMFFELGQVVGIEYDDSFFKIKLPSYRELYTHNILPRLQLVNGQKYILINTNSSDLCSYRRWPQGHVATLIDQLAQKYPSKKIVLTGEPDEEKQITQLFALVANTNIDIINMAGKTTCKELLGLIEHADIMISNDSGPAHFSAAFETPLVVLFGPETPTLYRPLNSNMEVIYLGCDCSPCMNIYDNKDFSQCLKNHCMIDIDVNTVLGAVEKLYASTGSGV